MALIYMLVSLAAAVHAYMFARWLYAEGNKAGAWAAGAIAAACAALPAYRYFTAP